jgi:hypothetical protein
MVVTGTAKSECRRSVRSIWESQGICQSCTHIISTSSGTACYGNGGAAISQEGVGADDGRGGMGMMGSGMHQGMKTHYPRMMIKP